MSPDPVVSLSPDSTFTEDEPIPEAPSVPAVVAETLAASQVLAALMAADPDDARKAVAAGALLVSKAGDLWDALLEVSESNTAKPLLDKIVDVALTVALAEDPPDL